MFLGEPHEPSGADPQVVDAPSPDPLLDRLPVDAESMCDFRSRVKGGGRHRGPAVSVDPSLLAWSLDMGGEGEAGADSGKRCVEVEVLERLARCAFHPSCCSRNR